MSGVNPQGVSVHSFKVPSAEELDHDFLWRYAQRLPGAGEIGIFNRSHYEEVLVVRVHPENLDRQQLPRPPTQATSGSGATRDQRLGALPHRQRLPGREALPQPLEGGAAHAASCGASTSPTTTGSSPPPTCAEREHWDDYQKAFSEMLSHTSTEWAPWYVIPADRKWFARIAAARGDRARADRDRPALSRRSATSSARRCSRSRRRSRRRRRRARRPTRSRRSTRDGRARHGEPSAARRPTTRGPWPARRPTGGRRRRAGTRSTPTTSPRSSASIPTSG